MAEDEQPQTTQPTSGTPDVLMQKLQDLTVNTQQEEMKTEPTDATGTITTQEAPSVLKFLPPLSCRRR